MGKLQAEVENLRTQCGGNKQEPPQALSSNATSLSLPSNCTPVTTAHQRRGTVVVVAAAVARQRQVRLSLLFVQKIEGERRRGSGRFVSFLSLSHPADQMRGVVADQSRRADKSLDGGGQSCNGLAELQLRRWRRGSPRRIAAARSSSLSPSHRLKAWWPVL
nr:hypothetical protein Itr_chr04CG21400 [Ipomoea trifida]